MNIDRHEGTYINRMCWRWLIRCVMSGPCDMFTLLYSMCLVTALKGVFNPSSFFFPSIFQKTCIVIGDVNFWKSCSIYIASHIEYNAVSVWKLQCAGAIIRNSNRCPAFPTVGGSMTLNDSNTCTVEGCKDKSCVVNFVKRFQIDMTFILFTVMK